jgi:hypothetical protein
MSVKPWSPPVTRPKLCSEYASIRLEPVEPIPSYVTRAYERYVAKKGELQAEKDALVEKIGGLQAKLAERVKEEQGKYRAPSLKDDTVTTSKKDEIVKQTEALASVNRKMDSLDEDNKAVEEYMGLHKKMEESYAETKALQDASRTSWAAMYSSV